MKSSELQPGTRLRYKRDPKVYVLDRRKRPEDELHGLPVHPGWWLCGGDGGLADFVLDDPESPWTVVDD